MIRPTLQVTNQTTCLKTPRTVRRLVPTESSLETGRETGPGIGRETGMDRTRGIDMLRSDRDRGGMAIDRPAAIVKRRDT